MKAWQWVGLAALAFFVVGLVFGFAPVKADGYDCGSAFRAKSTYGQQLGDTLTGGKGDASACEEARSNRQPIAWAAIGVAAVLGVGALVMATKDPEPRSETRESGAV